MYYRLKYVKERLKCFEALVRGNAMNKGISNDMEKFKVVWVDLNLL
jgi:hypothetical protein